MLMLLLTTSVLLSSSAEAVNTVVWRWICKQEQCHKVPFDGNIDATTLGLEACKMFCSQHGTLWPFPTGEVDLGSTLMKLDLNSIEVNLTNNGESDAIMLEAVKRFKWNIQRLVPEGVTLESGGKSLIIYLVNHQPDITSLTLKTDEAYSLSTKSMEDGSVQSTITASNFFGVRHGLETLAQLILYDEIRNELQVVQNAKIKDKPVYPYRGILLDTARNYYSIDSIKRTIDSMAAVKLNTFHWHITDSQSFPFASESQPNLTLYGAFSPSKVYTKAGIKDVVEFARARGVRVLPEFDAPAHVGEGWQGTDLTVCFNAVPWNAYCGEPPCGQLNPVREELYDVLEDIYKDIIDAFEPDMFHMGGDEVSDTCWNSSPEIQRFMLQRDWGLDRADFLKLWDYFQGKAKERLYKANKGQKLPLILWTSTLTEFNHVDTFLNKDDYIIQVWTTAVDPQINGLLEKGYKLILSNYDALYMDCGFGSWVGEGNNWCSPYIGWQKVYDNSPSRIAGRYKDQILGGEAALWSEQSDASSLDTRLWPRAAAFAERLWAEPTTSWVQAKIRMLHVRERLVKLGVQADSIQPEWCFQNEAYCPVNSAVNQATLLLLPTNMCSKNAHRLLPIISQLFISALPIYLNI